MHSPLVTTVVLDVTIGVWRLPHNITMVTRLYNGVVPSPPIYTRPGHTLKILLKNSLGPNIQTPNDNNAVGPGFRDANTTNLHVHGIYADAHDDDTFTPVPPGGTLGYEYHLHPQYGTSLLYYHPHADGSSTLQTAGGMGGAVVIIDDEQEAALALPTLATRVMLLQVLHMNPSDPDFIGKLLSNDGSSVMYRQLDNPLDFRGTLLLINGCEAPKETVPPHGWLRLKLVNALVGGASAISMGFVSIASAEQCEVRTLALDGVWLRRPRRQRSLYLPSGGRAEVALVCHTTGLHVFGSVGSSRFGGVLGAGYPIVELDVRETSPTTATSFVDLPMELPGPPPFYADLTAATAIGGRRTLIFGSSDGGNVINGRQYDFKPSFSMAVGSLQEWRIEGGEEAGSFAKLHPYHTHMTHFQVVEIREGGGGAADPDGEVSRMIRVGDWRDTVPLYGNLNFTVRFVAPFEGKMMIHCHILKHSENGMMTIAAIRASSTPLRGVDAAPSALRSDGRTRTDLMRMSMGRSQGAHGPTQHLWARKAKVTRAGHYNFTQWYR